MSSIDNIKIKVELTSLGTGNVTTYNTTLDNLLNGKQYEPLTSYLSCIEKKEEFITFPPKESIISILEKQGYYLIINEVIGLSIKVTR